MTQHRMTKQKQMVLSVVQAHYDHPTADELFVEVRSHDQHISRATVYRNLEQLCESGLLLQVKVPGAARFDARCDFHYHTFCTHCGAIADAPVEYQHQFDSLVAAATGYHVERHRCVFEGLCGNCQTAQTNLVN